jgi:hypothetical protein
MLYKNRKYYCKKTNQCKVSVKDDNYDACNTTNIKISDRQTLAKCALTCYGGSIHERLWRSLYTTPSIDCSLFRSRSVLSESSRPYMLAYYLSALIDGAYFLVS